MAPAILMCRDHSFPFLCLWPSLPELKFARCREVQAGMKRAENAECTHDGTDLMRKVCGRCSRGHSFPTYAFPSLHRQGGQRPVILTVPSLPKMCNPRLAAQGEGEKDLLMVRNLTQGTNIVVGRWYICTIRMYGETQADNSWARRCSVTAEDHLSRIVSASSKCCDTCIQRPEGQEMSYRV
jgi:hypothetical protein